jgi:hypothetical protein
MIRRREFIKLLALGLFGSSITPEVMAQVETILPSPPLYDPDSSIKDYLHKMKNFDRPHKDDMLVSRDEYDTFTKTVMRLRRLEHFVGHGNFQFLNFENGIYFSRNYSQIGEFSKKELEFMEKIFYMDAAMYGFLGKKPIKRITDHINKREVIKVPYSGNFICKGTALEKFGKIKKKVGEELILTSGIRGVMKQFLLFLNKAYKKGGNLSLASRSLAPPGYSFHGIGDFDVGQAGFGINNFTVRFTTTKVYKRLLELGYLRLRYPDENLLGVRFEPWHIEITEGA